MLVEAGALRHGNDMPPFRLGTRGSALALVQAGMVRAALCAAHGWTEDQIETVVIRTTGDRVQDRALAEIGGKALWTKELDRALLAGEVDACVHSMKDVETIRPSAIRIAATLPRADVRDRLIGSGTAARRHDRIELAAATSATAPPAAGPPHHPVPRQRRHAPCQARRQRRPCHAARRRGPRPARPRHDRPRDRA
jgi:hypothetical protein